MNRNRPTPPDDFEQQLARTPRRTAPPEWRADILAAATAAARSGLESPCSRTGGLSSPPTPAVLQLWSWLNGISPAWRALAAVWAVCLTVNHFTNSPPAGSLAARDGLGRLAPEQIAAARAQRAELLQLAGLAEPEPAEPPPLRPPGPRSSLRRLNRPVCG